MSFFTFHTAMFLSATDSSLMIAAVSYDLTKETRRKFIRMERTGEMGVTEIFVVVSIVIIVS